MGRIARDGLDWFNIDTLLDANAKILIAKHKMEGWGILVMLWQRCYANRGYYMEWAEDDVHLFAYEINTPVETIISLVETAFKYGIFHRGMWEKYQILTSSGIQKRWLGIVTAAKRMNTTINPEYSVLQDIMEITTGDNAIPSGKTPGKSVKTPERMPRSEVKGSEVKRSERKKNVSGADAPGTGKPKRKKKGNEPSAAQIEDGKIWQACVDAWFNFYELALHEKPSFAGRDPATLKNLLKMIRKKVLDTGYTWSSETCAKSLTRFLQIAFADPWLKTNFLLQNLLSQFDKIIANGKSATNQSPAAGGNGQHEGAIIAHIPGTGPSSARTAALNQFEANVAALYPTAGT